MPVAASRVIWLDGILVPWDDARVHVLTHALNHGTAVFEGIRCYATGGGPVLFRLEDHVERLGRSARTLDMKLPATADELAAAARELVVANELGACYLRMLAYRAYGEMGIDARRSPVSIWIAAWAQAPSFPPAAYEAGLRVTISSWRRGDANVIPPSAKIAGAYVTSSLARGEAARAGFDEAIMLAPNGNVSEASIENVFAVRDGELRTPPLSDGPLPGITRATVIDLAGDAGIPCRERSLTRADLYEAHEVFLTGTGAEIVPVREIDGRCFEPAGPVTAAVRNAYARVVAGRDERRTGWLSPIGVLEPAGP